MTYTPTEWEDEVPASSPVKYTLRDSGGSILYDDVTIEVKTSLTAGTQLNAANMNKLEGGVEDNADDIDSILADMAGMLPDAFTAKGQIPRGSAAGAMALLSIGAAGKSLKVNAAGDDIEWGDGIDVYTAEQSTNYTLTETLADITGLSVNVEIKRANSLVVILAGVGISSTGAAPIVDLVGVINGAAQKTVKVYPNTDDEVPYIAFDTVSSPGTVAVKIQAKQYATVESLVYRSTMIVLVI